MRPEVSLVPVANVSLCLLAFDPVAFLNAADQLFELSVDNGQVIIGQLAPLLSLIQPSA